MKTLLLLASLIPLGPAMAVETWDPSEPKPLPPITIKYYCGYQEHHTYRFPLKFQVVNARGTVLDSGSTTVFRLWNDCIAAAKKANEAVAP